MQKKINQNINQTNHHFEEYGKLPPQCVSIEKNILGRLLNCFDLMDVITACGLLKPEMFYKESHGKIFNAIQLRFQKAANSINLVIIGEDLRKTNELDNIGGAYYLATLSNSSCPGNTKEECMFIIQKFIGREMIRINSDSNEKLYDESIDILDVIDSQSMEIMNVKNHVSAGRNVEIDGIVNENLVEIKKRMETGIGRGISTGYLKLDKHYRFVPGNLIIIACRPSMGKTAFAMSTISQLLYNDVSVGIFSLEMTTQQLINRLLQNRCEIDNEFIDSGKLTAEEYKKLEEKSEELKRSSLYIDDTSGINIVYLRSKAITMKMKKGIDILFIDYLQLMKGVDRKGKNRDEELGDISRDLKSIAKELKIPVVALAQLNRSVEDRSGNRPRLSDLRESGNIEQDADDVLFIHRPEYYGQVQFKDGSSTKGVAEIIIEKHRNGKVLKNGVGLMFEEKYAKFYEEKPVVVSEEDKIFTEQLKEEF